MKILTLLVIIPQLLLSQEKGSDGLPRNKEGKVDYFEVVPADTIKAGLLYSASKIFITKAFKSGKDVTQLTDDDTKTITTKAIIPVTVNAGLGQRAKCDVYFRGVIECKDGRYRYSFSDFEFVYQPGTATPVQRSYLEEEDPKKLTNKQWAQIKEDVNKSMILLIDDMKKALASAAKSNW